MGKHGGETLKNEIIMKKVLYEGVEIKTIADLPKEFGGLDKIKVKAPDGTKGWWVSQWQKGVWLKEKKEDSRVLPIFVEDLKECLSWEVLEISK